MKALVYPLAGVLLLASFTALADESIEAAIGYRQGAMKVIGWNFKPMGAMVKGDKPYDKKAFAMMAKDLAAAAHLNLLAGYSEDSESDNSKARPEIWMNWEEFEKKMGDFRSATAELSKVAGSGDQAAIKKQFMKTAKTCKGCHKEFKAKKK